MFVCLADDPPAFALQLFGLEALIKPYHMEQMALKYVAEESWETNWKCFVENYMEGYHLTSLHRQTLHEVNPSKLCHHYPPAMGTSVTMPGFHRHWPRAEGPSGSDQGAGDTCARSRFR